MPKPSMRNRSLVVFLPVLGLAGLHALPAQCQSSWLPGEPYPTPIGDARASALWDPDGAGPLPVRLVVGGKFSAAAETDASTAIFDGTQWTVPTIQSHLVTALGVHNGDLYAAMRVPGSGFPSMDVTWIATLNGLAWLPVGITSGVVFAITSYNGDLVVGGNFTEINGTPLSRVARRTGATWTSVGGGVAGVVRALTVFNGSLYTGGTITSAGGAAAGNLVSWNGSAWSVGPTFNGSVSAFAVRSSVAIGQSYLFVGGAFSSLVAGAQTIPAARIARFEPQAVLWSAVGSGLPPGTCSGLAVRTTGPNGFEVAAAGSFTPANQPVHRWNGSTWSPLGSIADVSATVSVSSLAYHGNRYTVTLANTSPPGTAPVDVVRAWDGAQWQPVYGRGIVGTVHAVEPAGSDVVIGGTFTTIAGATVNGIARGATGAWTPLGTGVEGGTGVRALATAANGDVIAAGDFTIAGGAVANRIARWDGTAWSPLGLGMNAAVHALLVLPGGDVVAAGEFTVAGTALANRIARWDGTAWSPLGAGVGGRVRALARLDNGDIVAAGEFDTAGGIAAAKIARFSSGTWHALGSGCNDSVLALATAPNGELYAGGDFTVAGGLTARLARWSNNVWSAVPAIGFGAASVTALLVHPSGEVRAGLAVAGGSSLFVGPGGSSNPALQVGGNAVLDIAIVGDDVVIGGDFVMAGLDVSHDVAHLEVPCPGSATPYGAGCSGLTAPLALTALATPWLGGTSRLQASTFGPTGFAVHVFGVAQLALPLGLVLPGSLPGCSGLASPDFLEVLLPGGGAVAVATPVPWTWSLIGAQFHQQVLQLEAGPGGFAISSSNGVQLVVGVL